MIRFRREKPGRNIRQQISALKEQFRSVELKPCKCDAELKQKDNDLLSLRNEIYSLEKQIDQFAFPLLHGASNAILRTVSAG